MRHSTHFLLNVMTFLMSFKTTNINGYINKRHRRLKMAQWLTDKDRSQTDCPLAEHLNH